MKPCPHPAERLETLFPASDYVTGDPFEIRRCRDCGLALTWPPPPPSDMARYYPDAYYGRAGERRFVGPVEGLQQAVYGSRARKVEEAAGGRPGRVLDVGCGRGFLLDAFRRRGWAVEGTEMSDASSAHAREVLGIPVRLGPLESLALPAEAYDAVTLWHVLEHVTTPGAMLDEIHRILKPGGVLLVSVPNFGSPEARVAGPGWFHLDVPRHLVHFTPNTLDAALRGAGLEPVSSAGFAPEFDAFSFVQSTLNWIGLRQNSLYDLLRGRAAKLGKGGRATAIASVALAAPLGVLSVPATLIAGVAHAGSTLTVLARRG
jgi:2-polyprenyl-3-methyl-5-hydroxy-6-metoxy-1,4-benzoquinol methylase